MDVSSVDETELAVTGMNCANCARHVTEALQSVGEVASAEVSLQLGQARVRWRDGADHKVASLVQAVEQAGYTARPVAVEKKEEKPGPLHGWKFNVLLGSIGTIPLMAGEWVFHLDAPWFRWASFALAAMVQVVCGARFYRGAWRQLRVGGSNMDTLVALGSTTAFAYSAWMLLAGARSELYFMEAAAIITLISVGHWMEELAGSYAEQSLRALLHLAPETAWRRDGASETEVPVAELRPGDAVALRPGARVPTDGILIDGHCSVDESMLTGESAPVEKESGTALYAGTLLADGRGAMRVTGVGEATAMAHIIDAVKRAQNSRAEIQRLADKISNVFVPIVLAVALGACLWWALAFGQAQQVHGRLSHFLWVGHFPPAPLAAGILAAVAVLIVACPCAMGLATPIAIMAGANAAAKRGILIRDGVALEKAGRISAVLLDKTGTLTLGKPEVVATNIFSKHNDVLRVAAALAGGSHHPLSVAVAKSSAERVELSDWREIRGAGIEAQLKSGGTARLGSLVWLKNTGVDISPGEVCSRQWLDQGATLLGVAIDRDIAAVMALRDTPKPGIAEAVQKLKEKGLKIFLVTGDNPMTAASIAREAGIAAENVFSQVQPEQKAGLVKKLRESGERVAFVGDGINDAPALEQADLGIAVGEASDVAGEAADIILLQSNIQAIPEAIDLAQATLRTIRQNLFWAFFYNAAAIPLAALGFLSPILCAASMGISDLMVIGNALLLNRRVRTRNARREEATDEHR